MGKAKEKLREVPQTLGACADLLMVLKGETSELNRQFKLLKSFESEIKNKLIDELPKSQAEGVTGKTAQATITKKPKPTVKDWSKLYAHILKTKDFSFLNCSVGAAAVKEHWEAGEKVPGVEAYNVIGVSVTKKK